MKDKITILALLFIVIPEVAFLQTITNGDTLFWNKNIKLRGQDFIVLPEKDILKQEGSVVMATNPIGFYYAWDSPKEHLIVDVYCFFDRKKSWISDTASSSIDHAQICFDITEVFVRKIRKKLISNTCSKDKNYSKSIRIINRFVFKAHRMKSKFNEETNFGKNLVKKNKWRKKINAMLSLDNDYYLEKK